MNKRILEIAERAGYHINGGKIFIRTTSEDITSCQQKFAELLIKECIRIDVENPDAAPGVEIAKYFGVE